MTREEIIAKWNGMGARERDAWVFYDVLGLMPLDTIPNEFGGFGTIPRYTSEISAAWSVLEQPGSDGLPIVWAMYPTADGYNVEYALGHEVVSATTAPEAICLAAIIAKLTD